MNAEVLIQPPQKKTASSSRKDIATANYVDMAISIQRDYGTSCAVEYLQSKGVQNDITKRVLSQPEKRRGYR